MKTLFRQQTPWGGVYTDTSPAPDRTYQIVVIPDTPQMPSARGISLGVIAFTLMIGIWVSVSAGSKTGADAESFGNRTPAPVYA